MNTPRDTLITQLGATLLDNGHCCFSDDGNYQQLPENFIAPLRHYGALLTAGPDSSKFLQGQTTCNFDEILDHQARLGAFCNPKGRMISSFLAARCDEQHYVLRMRLDLLANTQSTFGKYIVFSKAEQTDISDQTLILGLHGEQAKNAIIDAFGQAPDGINQVVNHQGQLAIQLDEQGLSYECWLELEQAQDYWATLSKNLTAVGSTLWQRLKIQQGIGEVSAATSNEFIPQLLNFSVIGAISFDKGCYTGQEVIARLHYRGKSKRALYRISLKGEAPQEGQELYSDKEQSIGTIINQASVNEDHHEALAVITHSEVEKPLSRQSSSTQVSSAQGSNETIEILELPYAITNEPE